MSRTEILDLDGKINIDKMRPYGDHITILVIKREKSEGGIFYPEKRGEGASCTMAKVIAVGSGEENPEDGRSYPINLKKGDIIITMEYMGERIVTSQAKYRLLREHGVWAKVTLDENHQIMNLEPYSDHVLLSMAAEEKTLSGTLFLPDDMKTGYRQAKVVKVGPGKRQKRAHEANAIPLAQGDTVICVRYAGANIRVKGVEYRLVSEADIEAILEK